MEDVSGPVRLRMANLAGGDERCLKLAGLKVMLSVWGVCYSAHIDENKNGLREKSHLESQNKRRVRQINAAIAQPIDVKREFLAMWQKPLIIMI